MNTSRLDAIFDPLDSGSAPGGSIAVEVDGKIIYSRGFGLASVESGLANTPRTRGRIGSTTKQFTCLAVMLLAEDGLLDVDAPLRQWIPELHPELPPVTVRQAMNHTAGLRCWVDLLMLTSGMFVNFPESEVLPLIARQRGVQFAPGSRFVYSNTGARLLTVLIERISDRSYETFLRERVFAALGMWDTCLPRSEYDLLPALACPHIVTEQGFRRGMMPGTVLGEGGLVSTVHDLMRWTAFLRAPYIGSATTWHQMLKPTRFPAGDEGAYALGLVGELHRGTRVVHHAGTVLGANSQVLVAPEHKLGLAILVNRSDVSATELGWKVLDALISGKLAPAPPVAVWPAAGAAAGFYVHAESGRTVALEVVNERLCFDLQVQHAPLSFDADCFTLSMTGISPIRLKLEGGSDAFLRLEQWGGIYRFDQRRPVDGTPYLPRIGGRYFSAEADAEVRIHATGPVQFEIRGPYGRSSWRLESLEAESQKCGELPEFWLLRPLEPTPIRWIAMRLVVRGGLVQGLEINTPRTWALRFDRI